MENYISTYNLDCSENAVALDWTENKTEEIPLSFKTDGVITNMPSKIISLKSHTHTKMLKNT